MNQDEKHLIPLLPIVPTKSLLCGLCKLGVCGTIPREAKYGMDTPSNFLKLKENLGGWILAHSLKDPFMLEVYPLLAFPGAQCLLLVFTKCLFMVELGSKNPF